MKKKTNVKTVIRKIVREEVAIAIKEVITELRNPVSKNKPMKEKIINEKQYFTSNKLLNDVLNETVEGEEWETMGQTKYTSERMGEIVGNSYKDLMSDDSENSNGSLAMEMGVNPNDPAAAFLKKDYRKLMKKVEEKTGKI